MFERSIETVLAAAARSVQVMLIEGVLRAMRTPVG
jgi:hypothetical protein